MKKYAFAGASGRALGMYLKPMLGEFKNYAVPVGVYDINKKRSEYFHDNYGVPAYLDFDEMLKKSDADTIIVTTVDGFHHEYIIRSLMAGKDVITEKPMTIDATKAKEIIAAEKASGKKLTVTFNYRYAPYKTKIKEIIASGAIGEIYSVDFEWFLDRNMDISAHGTSYFRRWNRYLEKSGGLLVHKATHHFDLINWWIDDEPDLVSAFGKLRRYGKNGTFRGKNCRNCEHTKECEFFYDITKNDFEMAFYADAESEDGYYKDGCVFAEDIDIYDTMSVNVQYKSGTMLSYSLNATCAYEGWKMTINGSKGRLEAFDPETGNLSAKTPKQINVFDLDNNIITYDIASNSGGHGGGDSRLLRSLFVGDVPDPLGHQAGLRAGLNSILVGAAANISIKEQKIIKINDLVQY